MVVAAGVDAARDLDLELAHILGCLRISEAAGDVLGDRDGAGIGQGAIVQARAGDDVADQVDIGRGQTGLAQGRVHRRQVVQLDMRQDQVLLVGHADLTKAEALGQVGDQLHLLGAGVPGGLARLLQRHVDDGIAANLVRMDVLPRKPGQGRIGRLGGFENAGGRGQHLESRRREIAPDTRQLLVGQIGAGLIDLGPFGLDLAAKFRGA